MISFFFLGFLLAFIVGNIITFLVYLAPITTFHKVYKKQSTEGFQSLPYVVELFGSMLSIYYAILKQEVLLDLIAINSVGSLIETLYIALFLFFAPKKSRMQTIHLVLLIALGYGLMVILTLFLANGHKRIQIVGWICLIFNLIVFAAPLCIMRKVIRTRSVEFMPFPLLFLQTLGAVTGFFYWLLLKDYKFAFANVLGFIFGIVQMGLYIAYRNRKEISQEPMVNPRRNQAVLQPNDIAENVINIIEDDNFLR
ncbi:bidirectional sugar transporter SWEET14-like [Ziziphus jujuba]|uniref:Bidirectional sugar transporter SWEET n=1 Tax=Ziziphus jujuba TaxID=326968 RepID=A0ABM3IKU2_ZIZJJ|nr:bidirectional sugar transporter SWEET14-like [Ziziphus jujuba]